MGSKNERIAELLANLEDMILLCGGRTSIVQDLIDEMRAELEQSGDENGGDLRELSELSPVPSDSRSMANLY